MFLAPFTYGSLAQRSSSHVRLHYTSLPGKSTQFELPGKFMKVSYNDSSSD